MRVTNAMTDRMLVDYMLRNRQSVYSLQEKIASGKEVLRSSDDPGSFSLINQLYDSNAAIQQYSRNTNRLMENLLITDQRLQDTLSTLHRTAELATSGGDSNKSPSDRKAMAEELNMLLESMVSIANANPEGRYIFAGLRTDTPAYEITRDANGWITDVTYQGSEEIRFTEVSRGVYMPDNIVGSDLDTNGAAFQTQEIDVFMTMIHARDRLHAGENLAGAETFTASAATNTLTVEGGVYTTGSTVRLESTETLPGGLNADTSYYVIRLSDTEIQLAASLDDARNGIAINLTNDGSGEMGITQQTLGDITRCTDHIVGVLSQVGVRQEQTAFWQRALVSQWNETLARLEGEESVDMAKAATDLASKQTAYEAALRVTLAISNTSLLNYL